MDTPDHARTKFRRQSRHHFFVRAMHMKSILSITTFLIILCTASTSSAEQDTRQMVQLPAMMQQHMLSNMRDHLSSLNEILTAMAGDNLEHAADIAESRLGMSSLESHGASHMAEFMPEGMRIAGTSMHKAASRFALKAQEGEALPAYQALSEITSACVTCHSGYRIR